MTTTLTSGAADLPEALRVPLDSLHADAGYLCGRLLNGSLTQEQVVESIRRRIDAAKLAALTAQAISAESAGAGYAAWPEPEVHDEGGWHITYYTATMMRAFADATHALRASHGQAPAGAAEEIDKALNVYAQAFAARVNGWTRQNGDDLPGARSALFAAIHAYAQASTRPTTSPQAENKKKAPL